MLRKCLRRTHPLTQVVLTRSKNILGLLTKANPREFPMQAITGFRLSPQQERVWALQQSTGTLPFHARCASLIEGPLDKATLEAALLNVIERQEILHTTFHKVEGMIFPLQVISDFRLDAIPVCDL